MITAHILAVGFFAAILLWFIYFIVASVRMIKGPDDEGRGE